MHELNNCIISTNQIISKVWSFCHTLRDDGFSYGDYLEQLSYLLFLKMADELSKPPDWEVLKRNIFVFKLINFADSKASRTDKLNPMKYFLLLVGCVFTSLVFAQQNYMVQIGDSSYNVSLDSSYQISLAGKKMKLLLKQKDVLSYQDSLFTFSYLPGFQVTKTEVESTVDQYLVLTADASGFVLQAFRTLNPTGLNETMLREATKEYLNYGYKMEREDTKRVLPSGQSMDVAKATLTFKDKKMVVEVGSVGSRDEGILVMTIDAGLDYTGKGKELIKLLWESLRYNK